ncbi:MAG TPA: hypothetical protein VHL11_06400 [Phototrophicaceae bacterium]|jgi:hypothetical protein|nr:hypothetical protein [Phototrophicaceae bacterium]
MFQIYQNYETNQYHIEDLRREVQNDLLADSLSEKSQFSVGASLVKVAQRFQTLTQRSTQSNQTRQLQEA